MFAETFDPETNRWYKVGEVFDDPYDTAYIDADDTDKLVALRDIQLLEQLAKHLQPRPARPAGLFEAINPDAPPEYSPLAKKVRELAAERGLLDLLDRFVDRLALDDAKTEKKREDVKNSKGGWDFYGKVKPFMEDLVREQEKDFSITDDQRKEIIEILQKLRYSDYEVGDDVIDDEAITIFVRRHPDDPPWKIDQPYMGRNYDLFAYLANVRNGFGFAGVDTGDAVIPIDQPRGVPVDCSPEFREYVEKWGIDGHSHSWLTLRELMDFDWDGEGKVQRGLIDEEFYDKLDENGAPPPNIPLSGWASGPTIVVFSVEGYEHWKEMGRPPLAKERERGFLSERYPVGKAQVEGLARRAQETNIVQVIDEVQPQIQIEWKETAREAVGESFMQTIEALKELGFDPDHVRIVFLFDN